MLVFLVFQLGGVSLRSRIAGSATFDDVTGLVAGARVTVAGVAVGQVKELSVENGQARVSFILYEGHGLTEGALADVRARSLLGEKYLAIEPAPEGPAAPPLADGFVLEARTPAPSIDDVMAKLAPAIDKLPLEQMAGDLEELHRFLSEALPKLDDAIEKADLGELVAAAKSLRETLDAERPAIHRAIAAAGDVAEAYRPGAKETAADLRATAASLRDISEKLAGADTKNLDGDLALLRETLARLPATLDNLDHALAALAKLDPLIEKLDAIDAETLHRVLRQEGVRIRFTSPDDDDDPK